MVEAVVLPQLALADDSPGGAVPHEAVGPAEHDGEAAARELVHGDERGRRREAREVVHLGEAEGCAQLHDADQDGREGLPVAPGEGARVAGAQIPGTHEQPLVAGGVHRGAGIEDEHVAAGLGLLLLRRGRLVDASSWRNRDMDADRGTGGLLQWVGIFGDGNRWWWAVPVGRRVAGSGSRWRR